MSIVDVVVVVAAVAAIAGLAWYVFAPRRATHAELSLNPWMGRWFDRRVNSENAF